MNGSAREPGSERSSERRSLHLSRAAGVVVALCGVWLLVAPFVFLGSQAADRVPVLVNDLTVGAIVGGFALARVGRPVMVRAVAAVNMVAGVWLIAAPFVLGYAGSASAYSDMIVGVVVLVASVVGVQSARRVSSRLVVDRYQGHRQAADSSRSGLILAGVLVVAALTMIAFAVLGTI